MHADHGEVYEHLPRFGEGFVVTDQTAVLHPPSEGPLHDPPPREHVELCVQAQGLQQFGVVPLDLPPPGADDLQHDSHGRVCPALEATRVPWSAQTFFSFGSFCLMPARTGFPP